MLVIERGRTARFVRIVSLVLVLMFHLDCFHDQALVVGGLVLTSVGTGHGSGCRQYTAALSLVVSYSSNSLGSSLRAVISRSREFICHLFYNGYRLFIHRA